LASRIVAREAIVRARAFRSDMNVTHPDFGINTGVASARIMVVAEDSERHYSSPALSHRKRGIDPVVPRHASIALLIDFARMRVDREKCDSSSLKQ